LQDCRDCRIAESEGRKALRKGERHKDWRTETRTAVKLGRQLAPAGTGVAGNYRSACRARSHTEFTARMGIVLDESDESELWLNVCNERNWGNPSTCEWLLREAGELRAIFSAGYRTAKGREQHPR
jgi:four helix bundle protein